MVTHYNDVEPYFALDPLLPATFVALTPMAEFPLLCERMPSFLTASWLTHVILGAKTVDKEAVHKINDNFVPNTVGPKSNLV